MSWNKRLPKRRGLSSSETSSPSVSGFSMTNDGQHPADLSTIGSPAQIMNCSERPDSCGTEAACRLVDDSVSRCICPHDNSSPTADLKCPNRVIDALRFSGCKVLDERERRMSQIYTQKSNAAGNTRFLRHKACIPTYWKPPDEDRTGYCTYCEDIVPLTKPIPNIMLSSVNGTNSTTVLPEPEQVGPIDQRIPELVGIVLGCVSVLIVIIGFIYFCKRRNFDSKTKRKDLEASPMNLKKSLLLANKYTPNPQYFTCASPEVPILLRDSLVFLHDIGEGCFGKVFKGELICGDSSEVVAIKVLKDNASREAEEDFMREVDIMSTFRHENILSLIGVVLRDSTNSPWMVFEYMPYGDLAEVLRANSPTLRSPIPGFQTLTQENLHWITTQIASGMAYLAAQRFVHRDLACRNCLVGSGLVVKIADFGMSRDVYTCDYYKIGGSRLLPVRWMSPESVMYGRFTLESDVWSFGVVLWEVYSFGKQPYYGHNNEEVVKLILQGIMLIPPEDCPAYVCQIMRDCWASEPRDRLRFTDILERLDKAQDKPSQIGSLPRPPRGPVTIRTPDPLDPDGYLLPSPAALREYLQPLPMIAT